MGHIKLIHISKIKTYERIIRYHKLIAHELITVLRESYFTVI